MRLVLYPTHFLTPHPLFAQAYPVAPSVNSDITVRLPVIGLNQQLISPVFSAQTGHGWQGEYDTNFAKPFPVAQQQWGPAGFEPQGTIVSITPQGFLIEDTGVVTGFKFIG
jgi:hypothetical protein